MDEQAPDRGALRVCSYGQVGLPTVLLLHGGPGAPGYLAPVARYLGDSFRVLEPLQRPSGGEPLTVARHVADLHGVVTGRSAGPRPIAVGHSWGAMLGLAYAAAHPESVAALVLVSCGTWDPSSRECLERTRAGRMNEDWRRRLERLSSELSDPDEYLRLAGDLFVELDSWDLIDGHRGFEAWDARANLETWHDMVRMQEAGVYPAAFGGIRVPVLMLHGSEDPHPGARIRQSLLPNLPQLEYREWTRCGHYPWLERAVREEFLETLKEWLQTQFRESR